MRERDVVLGERNLDDELEVERDADRDRRRGEADDRAIVEAGAVADAVPHGVDRDRRHDDDVDLAARRLGGRGVRLAEAEAPLHESLHRREAEGHRAGLGIDPGVGDRDAARAERGVERAEIHLVALDDRPEERDRGGGDDGVVGLEPGDDPSRSLGARLERHRGPHAAQALAELRLHADADHVVGGEAARVGHRSVGTVAQSPCT